MTSVEWRRIVYSQPNEVHDYFLTLDYEVQLIWDSPWRLTKILYLMTRYLPFLDLTILLIYLNVSRPAVEDCLPIYRFMGWWGVGGIAIAEVLLTKRIWAVWEHSKVIIAATALLFTGIFSAILVLTSMFMGEIEFYPGLVGTTCINVAPAWKLKLAWLLAGAYDLVKRATNVRTLSWVLYTDGVTFYITLIVLAVVNGSLPDDLVQLLSAFKATPGFDFDLGLSCHTSHPQSGIDDDFEFDWKV
ncbi:hypothetical protein CC1G_07616 [Coprinopsis cinerea okayama7|uniref:DUF6533 domain-containing protein n=1 Tax=Coprinopsis cinerea (strain Okayama-7 / 130 / ATCC MYA-4618 / FGSC 9003) TaxID=240176 RepID=A8NUT9_COPC7|nr:hypothetical protein CC1G_07616 [Coprinopsis cinerea okayama7\|eukprot:XP_001836533.2 hypothetical protein CC1G_07616 [Coprinopsis cinerea okayama7\